jgi:X-Pro dipeptidyl-peptidase
VPNGIDGEPRLTIQREDGSYADEPDWPAAGARVARLKLSATSRTGPGSLAPRTIRGRQRTQSFVDRGRELDADSQLITQPDAANPNRLVYRTSALATDIRMSGTPRVRLRLSVDNRRAANLTAVLVDYGPDGPIMVTRGWLDPQNRGGISRSRPVRPGRAYDLRWDLQPDDYVWKAGHRIGLVVLSTDHDYTLRPTPGTRLTLDPAASELRLPIVGGATALGLA